MMLRWACLARWPRRQIQPPGEKQAVLDSVAVENKAVIDAKSRQLLKLQQEQLAFIKDIRGSLPDSLLSPKKPAGAPGKENNSSEASSVSGKKSRKSTSLVSMQVERVGGLLGVAQGQSSGFFCCTSTGGDAVWIWRHATRTVLRWTICFCAPSTGGGFWDSGTSPGSKSFQTSKFGQETHFYWEWIQKLNPF
jgi:hypothetical protein